MRENNTLAIPVELLQHNAQRKNHACLRRHEEQKVQEALRAKARLERRAARVTPRTHITAAVTTPLKVGEVPSGHERGEKGRPERLKTCKCFACSARGDFLREFPCLEAGTRAMLTKAWKERLNERSSKRDRQPPKRKVAAVCTSFGPPSSS